MSRFIYEQKVVAQAALAQTLWLQGFADQAAQMSQASLRDAQAADHPPSVCYALTEAICPVTLATQGPAALESAAELVIEATRRHGVSTWKARGRVWKGLLLLAQGEANSYAHRLRPALREIGEAAFVMSYTGFVSATCDELGRQGHVADGLELIERAIERARRVKDRCSIAELLRVRGELLLCDPVRSADAEAQLVEAWEAARAQESLAWQLRCATSLARLWHRQGRTAAARDLLSAVYAGFTEGFGTRDLVEARTLLDAIG
ncbi:MAG: hypothetical protein KIT73_02275 [Burkholderiales bacterium]|nr:hypothetical protein [Burkholderiales bacterium]